MAPWELTGKVRREERGHGVRKLPVPGAGWALQTPRRYSRCGGREQGQTEEERKCTWEENTQNLRHQTDKEVAFWGQRNTEEAPREALRHTSRISPARLAHSDHPANTFRQEWRDDNVSCAQTHSSQRHVDLEDKDGTARLHRVQSNPGDLGASRADILSHHGWFGPRQNGNKACDLKGTGISLPSPRVGGHTGGYTPSGPRPFAPRAKTLSQLGSPQPRESHPARPLAPQMCPEV